jgi:chromatin modification-related protein EAF6
MTRAPGVTLKVAGAGKQHKPPHGFNQRQPHIFNFNSIALSFTTPVQRVTAFKMAENVPPGSATKQAAVGADRPGLPYYEKLRRDLRDTLSKKRLLDRNMAAIEDQIYRQETAYLEETSTAGNIVKGFDNYIKASAVSTSANSAGGTISGSAAGGGMGAGRRKAAVSDADRVFSKSSVSYMRDSDSPSSATSTPNHAATPTGSFTAEKAGDKKKKKAATVDDESDSRATKRQKITFGAGRKGHD